ncbi:alpha/beta fold hydrolase [Sulfitobacter aestuariivivens]|uniref:Alpha/beta hydrolase n=1 Tax=Sulfitobacter aestuariivivens TaxID=2766981 RepID=A0A927HE93_9RHOB|nr:alpha/beta hydrolase [Sulfitobacter aestuariivivens]MBD3663143.1 alpha/beta hydrolase [Sulfitobacter aestuariivivens]
MKFISQHPSSSLKLGVKTLIFLLSITVFVVVVAWRAAARERAANDAHPPLGQMIEVDGVNVHAHVSGSGPDIVLLHGASGNLRDFTFDLVPRLEDRYRVIAFDRPGMGHTDRLPGKSGAWNTTFESPQEQAALLQKAAAQLGADAPIVLGHSYGGAVALAWALQHPEDTPAVVLVGAVAEPWPGGLGWFYNVLSSTAGGALLVPPATAFLPQSYLERSIDIIFAPQSPPAGYNTHVGADLSVRRFSARANAQQVNGLRPFVVEMQKQYDTLKMPIEVIHGTADTIVPADIHANVFAAEVPSANLVMLDGVGHMPHHADPDATIAAIDRAAARAGLR